MSWTVRFHHKFDPEYQLLSEAVQDELLASLVLLRTAGPLLGRPHVDTLSGSRHANMKELRFSADGGVWRAAFAFDPKRQAVVLVAADKSGGSQRRFYTALIKKADERFDSHMAQLTRSEDE